MDEKLNGIVQRMIDAGESEANIALVIQHYKPEPVKKKDSPQVAPKPSSESVTVQPSSVSSDFKIKPLSERKEIPYGVPQTYDELNPHIKKREELQKELASSKVTPENQDEVSRKTDELSSMLSAEKQGKKYLLKDKLNLYRQATQNTEQDNVEAQQALNATKQQTGIWNNVKSLAKQALTSMTGVSPIPEMPLKDEFIQAKLELIESGNQKPTPEQISQKADEIFLANKNKVKKQDRINKFIGSLDDDTKHLLEVDSEDRYKTLSKETNSLLNRVHMNLNTLHDLQDEVDNPELMPEDRQQYQSEILRLSKDIDQDSNAYFSESKNLGEYKEELDAFKRNYKAIDNFKSRALSSIGTAGIDMLSGLDYAASFTNPNGQLSRMGLSDVQDDLQVAREGINEYKEGFRPDNEELTTGNALQYFTDLMANQAGTIVQLIAAGETGGAALLGTQAAGQTYSDMSQEQKKGKKFAPWQMMLAPGVSGLSTGILSAAPTGQTLRNTARVWKAALKDPEGKVLYDQAIKGMTKSLLKETGADFKREVLTEELDNLNQNIIKRDILGDKSVGYFDNAYKVLTDTGLMTAGLSSPRIPHIFMDGIKKFTAPADKAILDANGRAIASLAQQLDNPDLSDEVKASIKSEIKSKTKESGKIVKQTLKRMDGLDESEIKTVVLDGKKIENIEKEAAQIKDSDMPIDAKKAVLNGLQKEHWALKEKTDAKLNEEIKKPVAKEPETQPQDEEQTKIVEVDEGKTTGTVAADGDIRSGALGDNPQGTENSKDAAAESGTGENTIVPKKIKLEGKGGTYTVSKTDGRIQVLDKDGKEPSSKTRAKVESKYAETVDFSSGKTAHEAVGKDAYTEQAVLNYSENPSEVAQAVTTFTLDDPQAQADYIQETIAENIGKIREEGFNRFDDRNNGPSQIAKAYFSPDGRHIDDLAKELSEIAGISVTEADIAQFIKDHPKGAKEFFGKVKESGNESIKTLNGLKDKFTALTGLPATVKNLHLAQEHFFQKEYNKEYGSTVDNMTEAQLQNYYNEILESEKNEKTTSKPKDNDEKPNRGGDEKESGVPRKGNEGNGPSRKIERKRIAEARIDEVADWLKSVLPKADIDLAEYKSHGFTQDQIIDIVAKIAKHLVSTGIEIEDAVRQATKMFKDQWSTEHDIDPAKVKERIFPKAKNKESIDELVRSIPKKDEVKQYLSGETIEKYEGESPLNNQDYKVQGLQLALEHGVSIIESFKKEFGDQYVEGALDYLEKEKLSPESAALIYVSLENDLASRKLADPDNVGISKLQNLVREKSQAFLRSNAIAINFGRLRKFAEAGYDLSNVTDMFFSTSELEGKRKIEKAVQSNADDINAEAEREETEGVEEVTPPAKKRTKADVKAEMGAVLKQMRKDLLNAAKGDTAMSSIPYAAQLQVATPHILKLSKLLAELGVVKTKEIVEEILQSINGIAPDISKEDIRDIINENSDKAKANTANRLVKQALIEKGFGREITVSKRKVNEDGSVTREKSKKEILDWKKLSGEEGSIDKIRKNVEQALADMGYTKKQIEGMYKELENEYHDLRALIIERSMNELDNRNTPRKPVDVKSSARRLAELYNYGLFEKKESEYDHLINNAVGLNELGEKAFEEAKELAGKLSELYRSKHNGFTIDEVGLSVAISEINNKIEALQAKVAWSQSNGSFKAASFTRDFMGMSQRMLLVTLGQAIENPFSGYTERAIQKLGHAIRGSVDTKELRQKRRELEKALAKDIVLNGGRVYGKVNTPLLAKTRIEEKLSSYTDSQLYHSGMSFLMGKAFLEGADGVHKIATTEKYFVYNLIKVLTHKSNPNRMGKEQAVHFVSEQLTGQSFEDAKKTAEELIKTVNKGEKKPILPENEQFKIRLANEIVKMALLEGKKMTLDQIKASYSAAYTTAGFGLGHEANNIISQTVNKISGSVEGELQKAVKDKKWASATALVATSMLTRNVMNPFVGGSFNWVVLQLQKTGLDPISMIINNARAMDNKIDLTTDTGMRNLENALKRDLNAKNTNNRVIIGALAVIATYAALMSGDDEEDHRRIQGIVSWLRENEWAKKYFNKISPQVIQLLIAMENEEVGSWLSNLMGSKYPDRFIANFSGGVNDIAKGDFSKGKGKLGKAFGAYISAPLPYKLVMDTKNIYLGLTGQELYKPNYETAYGFLNGFFQGGLIEYIGARPDSVNEEGDSGGLPKKPKMPSKPKKPTR